MKPGLPYFVFAGGGTGGHLYPALAVVEKLRAAEEGAEVAFFCTPKVIDADILGKARIAAMPLGVRPFPGRPWHWPAFLMQWRSSVRQCVRHFRERRPAAVIGAGGYASGPPVSAALRLGIPTFLLNPDAVPGRANRHMAAREDISAIFAQWEVTRQYLPATAPVMVTGCPVRSSFLRVLQASGTDRSVPGGASGPDLCEMGAAGGAGGTESQAGEAPVGHHADLARNFGLSASRRTLLVTGASQGARTLNEAMIELAAVVASSGWQVLHLAGAADADRVRAAYIAAEAPAAVLAFTDRMAEAMLLSDLIVSRAGASSLAEILAVGRACVLFPYPFHRDQHQRHNAQVLVDAGAAVRLEDAREGVLNARALAPVLSGLLQDDARREAMASAARALGQPDAADRIAWVLRETASAEAADGQRVVRADSKRLRSKGPLQAA